MMWWLGWRRYSYDQGGDYGSGTEMVVEGDVVKV